MSVIHTHTHTHTHWFIVGSFVRYVLCFFSHMPAVLQGKYMYVDAYLWPCIVSYLPFVRRNFVVVCHHVSDRLGCAAGENVAEHQFSECHPNFILLFKSLSFSVFSILS